MKHTTGKTLDLAVIVVALTLVSNTRAGPGIKVGMNVDVDLYALAPSLIWVTHVKPLGIKYGALITPSFLNANLNAEFEVPRERGGSVSARSFGVGDLAEDR
jgi:hypothetical protein